MAPIIIRFPLGFPAILIGMLIPIMARIITMFPPLIISYGESQRYMPNHQQTVALNTMRPFVIGQQIVVGAHLPIMGRFFGITRLLIVSHFCKIFRHA